MVRLPYLAYEDAPPAVREVLDRYPSHIRGRRIFGILSHASDAFAPMIAYGRALATSSELPARLREIAVLRVSYLSPGSRYIWVEHLTIAQAVGVSASVCEAIETNALDDLDPDDQLVIRFTDEIVRDATASDSTWAAISKRFTPREILELMLSIGHFMTFARIHATIHIELESNQQDAPAIDRAFFGAAAESSESAGAAGEG
jgi:4-carboxymuconolactone decarboxylase